MDFNAAMARAAEAEADGDDVAADNMRNAIRQQDENIKAAAGRDSEREDWLRQIDVQYINKCNDVEELQPGHAACLERRVARCWRRRSRTSRRAEPSPRACEARP